MAQIASSFFFSWQIECLKKNGWLVGCSCECWCCLPLLGISDAHHGLNQQHLHQLPVGWISCSISTKKDSVLHSVPDSTCLEYSCRNGVKYACIYIYIHIYIYYIYIYYIYIYVATCHQPVCTSSDNVDVLPRPHPPDLLRSINHVHKFNRNIVTWFSVPTPPTEGLFDTKNNIHCLLDELPTSLKYDFSMLGVMEDLKPMTLWRRNDKTEGFLT